MPLLRQLLIEIYYSFAFSFRLLPFRLLVWIEQTRVHYPAENSIATL